ncbi:MAG: glutathione S-transferase domain-containing protein [Gammaproteobacteria bacterium]|nr:glutathione S-transferase domain-containing protein [Gammaproteobacteria bacterium]
MVRVALWWLGLNISLKEVMFDANNANELTAGGGKFQVPCLRIETADGKARWMYESIDIIGYLKTELTT